MKRAFTWIAILAFVLAVWPAGLALAGENLLSNGGFETLTASGEPENWYATAYRSQPGYSRLKVSDANAHSGSYSAMIENASVNDARYTCTVRVKPSSLYKLSAYVLVESMEDTGNGANLSIEGIYAFSDGVFDTAGEWKYIEWYGETGESQTELTFGVRVGGYSAESTGKAYFDDVCLEEVNALPTGVVADVWYRENAGSVVTSEEEETDTKHTLLFAVIGLLFAAAVWLLRPLLSRDGRKRGTDVVFGVCLLLACVLRVLLAISIEGYTVDIGCFQAWSLRMAEVGPAGFYAPDYFCDYPPGAMLLLWPIGYLLRAAGQSEGLRLLIVKLPALLADIAGAICLYAHAQKRMGHGTCMALSCLYLFNPAVLVNGAAWGQMDSVLALLLMLTTFAAMERDWKRALPLFAVSALVKPQALLFAPVGLVWLIISLLSQKGDQRKRSLKQTAAGLGIALLAALVIVLPFSIHQPWNWLIPLYADTLSSYAYATLNTANLYYLAGANWAALDQAAPGWMMAALAVLFAGVGGALLHPKARASLCADAGKARTLCALLFGMCAAQIMLWLLGASYAVFGYLMMAFVYLFAILCMVRDRQRQGVLPLCMALALIGIYTLGIKVHERYLFPALLLLLISYCESRDRRVLGIFAGFSATTFLNTAIVLENCLLFGASQGHLNTDTLGLNRAMCVFNLALCAYAAYVGASGLRASKPISAPEEEKAASIPPSYERMLRSTGDFRLHWRWRDTLVVGVVTLAYAALAFSHLGSTAAPQTAWVSTSDQEEMVLELPANQPFRVLYYAGVSYNDFAIAVSEDGVQWSESYPCKMREGLCYRWLYAVSSQTENGTVHYSDQKPGNVLTFQGKYLKIKATSVGLNLWEVVARDESGNNLPLTLVSHTGGHPELLEQAHPAENLIDETDTCVGEPGWYNGTYFDEIYHARTAYEHLHGQAPYETTHPPLGKLLMAACIAIFGMTPFGWRFAGALIGVLMLPALYALGLQITHKRSVATVSLLAFALDLMHFTQTRIATIDSFPVFFILLSYLFMVRYMQMDPFAPSQNGRILERVFLKTWIPLGLSGLCMGLSIASKWIGMYSAVGLAVLFFLSIVRQYRAASFSWEIEAENEEHNARLKAAQNLTLSRILATCGACVVFFILVPLAIYCLCYIPYLAPTGPVTLKRIYLAQKGMLDYHSTPGLGMDHPFQSPWWQWPLILKPMWFAQDWFEPAGYASTIMCMGNPWVFYIGAVAMAAVLIGFVLRYVRVRGGHLRLRQGDGNLTLVILSIAFLAQYLPWVLVPRSMYMYHYFASVPIIILATAYWLEKIPKPKIRYGLMAVYVLGAAVFFVLFFPYASGYLTSTSWLDAMKWFSKLYY